MDSLSPSGPGVPARNDTRNPPPATAGTPAFPPTGPPEDDWGDFDDHDDAGATVLAPPDVEYTSEDEADLATACLIYAPDGPYPLFRGYDVLAAVFRTDDPGTDDDPLVARYLHRKVPTLEEAYRVACEVAASCSPLCRPRATHLLISDEVGDRCHCINLARARAAANASGDPIGPPAVVASASAASPAA